MGEDKKNKDQCCNQQNESAKGEESGEQKPSAECLANHLLAAQDATGMDLEKATQVIADDNADEETKADAEDMLATADEGNIDIKKAEEILAQEACNKQDNSGQKESGSDAKLGARESDMSKSSETSSSEEKQLVGSGKQENKDRDESEPNNSDSGKAAKMPTENEAQKAEVSDEENARQEDALEDDDNKFGTRGM